MGTECNKYGIRNAYRALVGRLKNHTGLVKLITATLQVVKYVETIFYFSVRIHFVLFKGKCSLYELTCVSQKMLFLC